MTLVIAITGVSGGLGLALTKWFTAQGHIVVGCSRSAEKIEQLNQSFCTDKPNQFFVVDIANDCAVKEWSTKVNEMFGPPYFVINNAGFINHNAFLWEIPASEFDKVLDINVKGSANVIRSFLPEMIKAGRGIIVNYSSGYGKMGTPYMAPYCAAKWGIEGMTRALAMELPSPLACVTLDPGVVNTAMTQGHFGGDQAARLETPEHWAEKAGPLILSFTTRHSGKSISV